MNRTSRLSSIAARGRRRGLLPDRSRPWRAGQEPPAPVLQAEQARDRGHDPGPADGRVRCSNQAEMAAARAS